MTKRKPWNQWPISGPSAKAWTDSTTPARVIHVATMVRKKVPRMRIMFQPFSMSRRYDGLRSPPHPLAGYARGARDMRSPIAVASEGWDGLTWHVLG